MDKIIGVARGIDVDGVLDIELCGLIYKAVQRPVPAADYYHIVTLKRGEKRAVIPDFRHVTVIYFKTRQERGQLFRLLTGAAAACQRVIQYKTVSRSYHLFILRPYYMGLLLSLVKPGGAFI